MKSNLDPNLEKLRNRPISGYTHPATVNKGKRGNVYSTFSKEENYKNSKTLGTKYKDNKSSYNQAICFLCEKPLVECTCKIQSSKN